MNDQETLAGYVDVWWQAVNDFTALLEQIPAEQWSAPTDLPGWDVRAVAAHIAHLEGILAGAPEETVDVGEPAHVTGLMGLYTEQGVVARAEPDARRADQRDPGGRHQAAHRPARRPADRRRRPSREQIFGGIGWDWNTLLRNRPLDVWMHEQDVRRAVGMPGGMDSPAARHTADYLAESLGFVLAKRVGAPAGTTVVLEVAGSDPVAYTVNEAGRGERLAEIPAEPTVALSTDRETFIEIAGGRRTPERRVRRCHRRHPPRTPAPRHPGGHPMTSTTTKTDTWSLSDMPDQAGRTIVVTGCTLGGLGHYTALELARHGGHVVLAGRTAAKLDDTEAAIRQQSPDAELSQLVVDLADLASVRRAAAHAAALGPIDCLVNNAGVMATPYSRTEDGLEMQMATNHFGPFLLTGLLLPQLVASNAARVVAVSSQMHRVARKPPLGDPRKEQGRYSRWPVYAETKLANLLFTYELDRRCREAGCRSRRWPRTPASPAPTSPSTAATARRRGGKATILDAAIKAVSQSAHSGALPTLMAATADLPGSTYCGPSGFKEYAGLPVVVRSNRLSRDEEAQRALWELSERATGIEYP